MIIRPALDPPVPAWAGELLAFAFAFIAGCPVLANLVGTYLADGSSFTITLAFAVLAIVAVVVAASRIGMPRQALTRLTGTSLALACVAIAFWGHWMLLNVLSPSPQPQMRYQTIQALVWIVIPFFLFLAWGRWLDPHRVIRWMVILFALFIIALSVRWALGLGYYHSGRWHAGKSLEAIRSGRYATMALWVFSLAALCPAKVIPLGVRILAMGCLPLGLFMMIATNARGPWLALTTTVVLTFLPLSRLLATRIGRDVRVLGVLLLTVIGIGAFVASQIASVESNFERLFSLNKDGGSAAGRTTLWRDHLNLLQETPQALLSGCGYDHGLFYPHNVLIEALTNGGALLLALMLAMLGVGAYAWVARSPRDDVPSLLLGGLFIISAMGSQVSGSIATDLTWFFPLLLVLAVARRERRQVGIPIDAARERPEPLDAARDQAKALN